MVLQRVDRSAPRQRDSVGRSSGLWAGAHSGYCRVWLTQFPSAENFRGKVFVGWITWMWCDVRARVDSGVLDDRALFEACGARHPPGRPGSPIAWKLRMEAAAAFPRA